MKTAYYRSPLVPLIPLDYYKKINEENDRVAEL